MKIMHFIHGLNTGGAETLVKNYALNFDKKKNDIVLLCLNHEPRSPYEKQLKDAGIRMIFVEDKNHFKNKVLNRCNRYLIIRKIIKEEAPDILHIHLALSSFVKFAKPDRKVKIFYTVHNEPIMLWPKNSKERRGDLRAIKWLVKKYGMKFIVLHEKMRKEINDLLKVSNTIVLNNGIDIKMFKNAKNKALVRRKNTIPLGAFVIGHIGRFSEQKNQEFLVDVFAEIKKENQKVFLLMVGNGADKEKIIKKMGRYGFGYGDDYLILSNRNDVQDLLAAMDVFVFPSRYEGLGIALIEAQESKLPCFVSDTVPEYATISNLVTRLSLGYGARKWAETILNYQKPKKAIVKTDGWDIREVTKKLEQIYREAVEE